MKLQILSYIFLRQILLLQSITKRQNICNIISCYYTHKLHGEFKKKGENNRQCVFSLRAYKTDSDGKQTLIVA